jgi:hypothetical protein
VVPFTDPDYGDFVQFTIVEGNPNTPVFFVDESTGEMSVNVDLLDYEVQSSYNLVIAVTDTAGLSAMSTVHIAVEDVNEPPFVKQSVCYVAENSPVGTSICTVSASDPDNAELPAGKLHFTLGQASESVDGAVQINSISGVLSVANSTALNYEALHNLTVTVCAQDHGQPPLVGCGLITVTLVDGNDVPTLISPQACEIDEYPYDLDNQQLSYFVGEVVCTLTVFDEDFDMASNASWKMHTWDIVEINPGCPFNVTSEGQIIVAHPGLLNYEQQKAWSMLVQATDLGGLASTAQRIEIAINDVNENPHLSVATLYIEENSPRGTQLSGKITVFDPDILSDGQLDAVAISLVGPEDMFGAIGNNIQVLRSGLNFEMKSTYVISIQARDSSGATSSIQKVNVVVTDVNEAPSLETMQYTLFENQPALTKLLPAVKAQDPDGDTVFFSMISESPKHAAARAPTAFGIDSVTGIIFQQLDALDYEETNEYRLLIKAQDNAGMFTTATITVGVGNVNESPQIKDQSCTIREDAQIGAHVGHAFAGITTDPDMKNGVEVLSFTIVNQNRTVFSIDPISGQVTTIMRLDFETMPVYDLRVRVTDSNGLYDEADFAIYIIDVNEPLIIGTFNISVPESLAPGSAIGDPIVAVDQDEGSVIQYDLDGTSGNVLACIRIIGSTGQLVIRLDCSLDYESSMGSTLPVVVRASDGEFTVSTKGIIYVTNVNEPPVLQGSVPALLKENSPDGSVVTVIEAQDPDFDELLEFWICEQSNAFTFRVQLTGRYNAELVVQNSTVLNFESTPSLWVDVCVQDKGNLTARSRYSITLLNVFEPAYFVQQTIWFIVEELLSENSMVGSPLSRYLVDEESVNNLLGCSVEMRIMNSTCGRSTTFTLDSCGQLRLLTGGFDYETMPICVISVMLPAASAYNARIAGPKLIGTIAVMLSVTDVNEPPVFSQNVFQFGVAEAATKGSIVGILQASDVDIGAVLEYQLLTTEAGGEGAFKVSASGVITVETALNFETKQSYQLSVRVLDGQKAYNDASVVVSVTDSNEAPVFRASRYEFSVEENAPSQTIVGEIVADDSDTYQNKTITYTIVSGNDFGAFTVLSIAGDAKLVVRSQQALDFERHELFTIIVGATDSGSEGLAAFATVFVRVADTNEVPQAFPRTLYIPEDAVIGTALSTSLGLSETLTGKLYASDPDTNDTLRFGISDTTDTFAIEPVSGAIVSKQLLNFERMAYYSLFVTIADTGNLSTRVLMEVIVLNRNDAPSIDSTSFTLVENPMHDIFVGAIHVNDEDYNQHHFFTLMKTTLTLRDNSTTMLYNNDVVSVGQTSGSIRVMKEDFFDYESMSNVILEVLVSDDGNPIIHTAALLTINVKNDNEQCGFSPTNFKWVYPENTVGVAGQLVAIDPDASSSSFWGSLSYYMVEDGMSETIVVSKTGAVTVKSPLDFEIQRSITFTAAAVDGGGLICFANVLLQVEDTNEPPVVEPSHFWVQESVWENIDGVRADDDSPARVSFWDPENDSVTLSQNSSDIFMISAGGFISLLQPVDFETKRYHDILVTAVDAHGNEASALIRVDIIDVNEPPIFTLQPTMSIAEDASKGTVVGVVGPAFDPDEFDVVSYQLVDAQDQGGVSVDIFMVHSCDGEIRMSKSNALDFETTAHYTLVLSAIDRAGLRSLSDPIVVEVNDVNEAPLCHDMTLTIFESATTDERFGPIEWSDPDSAIINTITVFEVIEVPSDAVYGIFKVQQQAGKYWLVLQRTGGLNYENIREYTVRLRIGDNFVLRNEATGSSVVSTLSSTCSATVQVLNVNEPPITAGDMRRSIEENSPLFSLVGAPVEASDPDEQDVLHYSIVTNEETLTTLPFEIDYNSGQIRVAGKLNHEIQASYLFDVAVEDSALNEVMTSVEIVVLDINEYPLIPRNCYVREDGTVENRYEANQHVCVDVLENVAVGSILYHVEALDEDKGQRLFYSVTEAPAPFLRVVQSDDRSCDLLYSLATFDYESVRMHRVQISVRDTGVGFLSDTVLVFIAVLDVNEPAIFLPASALNLVITENAAQGKLLGQLWAVDPEADAIVFSLIDSRPIQNAIDIEADGSIYASDVSVDYEALLMMHSFSGGPILTIRGAITTPDAVSTTFNFTMLVADAPEQPVFGLSKYEFAVHEHASGGTLIGVLEATDPDFNDTLVFGWDTADIGTSSASRLFSVAADSGVLSLLLSGVLNAEMTSRYALKAVVTDSTGLVAYATVEISIVDDNEPPTCPLVQCWVLEKSSGIHKGLPGTQGFCQAVVQDPDSGQKHFFQLISTADSRPFVIDYTTGIVQLTPDQQAFVNFEEQNVYRLRYQVNDIPDTGPSLACSNEIAITVVDINEAPTISGNARFFVAEMSPAGTVVGTIDANDEDFGDSLTFTLRNPSSLPFVLDATTGVLKVANDVNINFEASPLISFDVAVTDREGLQAMATLVVEVLDVNDPPVLQPANFTASEFALSRNGGSSRLRNLELLGSLHCFDEDAGDELAFALLNTTTAFVVESKSGMLYAETSFLDFESKRAYELSTQCSDGKEAVIASVWVFVTNINEAPIVSNQVYHIDENAEVGASLGIINVSDAEYDDVNFLTIDETVGGNFLVSKLQEKALVFSDSSDFKWTKLPEQLSDAFVIITSTTSPLSSVSLSLASPGYLFVLVDEDADVVPEWLSTSGFFKLEGERITAQSSSSALNFVAYIRSDSNGNFRVADMSDASILCFFGGYPSPLKYRIHGVHSEWFDVTSDGELLLATSTLDYESINAIDQPLQLHVNIVDSGGLMGEATLFVFVDDVNEAPVITSCCFEIEENPAPGTRIGELTAFDQDISDQIYFELAFPSMDIVLTLSGNLSVRDSALFDFEINSAVTIRVRVVDNRGLYSERDIQINLLDVNEPPVFQQSFYGFSVPENSASGLSFGTPIRAIDQDRGQTEDLRYELVNKNAGGLPFRLESCSGQLIVQWDKLDYESASQYSFGVRVIDSGFPVALDAQVQVTVDILDVNEAPTFAESGSLVILENKPNQAFIGQIIATDPDQESVIKFRTNASEYVSITESGELYSIVPFDYESMPVLYLEITVEDNGVYCDVLLDESQCLPISVTTIRVVSVQNVNEPPSLSAGAFQIRENLSPGSLVGKPLNVSDVDGTVGSSWGFLIVSGLSDGGRSEFTIRSDGQLLTLVPLDYESTAEYVLTVAYSDGEFIAYLNITITILDENESPSVVGGISGFVQENMASGTKVLTVKYHDPDIDSSNVFILTDGFAPFKIDRRSGELQTIRALDYEMDPTIFNLNVRVCDAVLASICGNGYVTVSVTNAPEAPSMNAITCVVVENTATVLADQDAGVCTFIASDPDRASCSFYQIVDTNSQFQLVQYTTINGVATTETLDSSTCTSDRVGLAWRGSSLPDYEVRSQYVVNIRVSDETVKATRLSVDSRVTVNVINANDCPTLTPLVFAVRERSPAATQIGYPLPGKDQDVSDVLSYAIASTNASTGLIGIDRLTGQLTVAKTPSDFELVYPAQYIVNVAVTDNSAQRCSANGVIKVITTKSNFAPVWLGTLPASLDIREDAAAGTQAGASLTRFVTDPDNDSIQFTLQSKTDTYCLDTFSLGLTSGAVQLRTSRSLDFEQWRTYTCTVAACDPGQLCSTHDVIVQVTDVNEPPAFSDSQFTFSVKENEDANFAFPRCLGATDPDEGDDYSLTYTLSCLNSSDCSMFSVQVERDSSLSLCAKILVKASLNYEARRSYIFTLTAQDSGKLTAVATIAVLVEDVNEVHAFVGFPATFSVLENIAIDTVLFQVQTTDPDIYSEAFRTIKYALNGVSPPGLNVFRMDSTTGNLIVNNIIDYEAVQAYTLTIEARDSSDTDAIIITKDMTVTVVNVDDTTVDSFGLVDSTSRTLSTNGGERFLLTGTNIGFKQRTDDSVAIKQLVVEYGAYGTTLPFVASNCELVNGNTGVECTSAPGVGANLYWNMTLVMSVPNVGDTTFQASSAVPLASYGSPVLTSVVCDSAFPTDGSRVENIFIYGENLGSTELTSQDALPVVLYGSEFVAQNCKLRLSTSSDAPTRQYVSCRSVLGTGQELPFAVVVRGQVSTTFSTNCRYASPIITTVTTSNGLQTPGGDMILINGSGFGCQNCATVTVRYSNGIHAFELEDCKVAVDHVQLVCMSRPGVGQNFRWQVSIDSQQSVLTGAATSYGLPVVWEVMGFKDIPTGGGTVFQLRGENFGPDAAIFLDPVVEYTLDNTTILRAVNCKRKYTDPMNHNVIQCVSVAGSGLFHSWRVVIESQASLWTEQNTSYAGPIVTKVFRPGGETEIKTSGDQQVVITGKNFGAINESTITSVTYGVNGDEFQARNCAIVIDHERILCTTAPGVGDRLSWVVTIDGLTSATPMISYAKPYITSIEGQGATNALVRGGQSVILRGGNFGPSDVAIDWISYGTSGRDYQVTEILEHDDSTIYCTTVPGVGANLPWIVSAGDQESTLSTVTSSYAPPVVTSFYPSVVSTDGSTLVTIIGENLGANVTFAASRVIFTPPQNSFSSYRIPVTDFGDFGSSNNSEYVLVRIPVGYGSGASLQLLVGTSSIQKSSLLSISYGPPVIDSVNTDEGPSECLPSCIQLTITGTNFFTAGRVLVSKYLITANNLESASYESSVEFSSWSHNTITVPQYVGRLGYVTVVIGREKLLSNSALFSWDDPAILDWYTFGLTCGVLDCTTSHRLDGNTNLFRTVTTTPMISGVYSYQSATQGGATLSLHAKFVGRSPRITVGGVDCTDVVVSTPIIPASVLLLGLATGLSTIREVSCTMPSGQGMMLPLVVVRGSTLSSPRYLSYIPPSVDWTQSSATFAPTTGKEVALTGANFGTMPVISMTGTAGRILMLEISSYDHSQAVVTIPPGEGRDYTIKLNAGNQEDSVRFNYDAPVVTSIEVDDATTAGGSTMTIRGQNFGSRELSTSHEVSLGGVFSCSIDSVDHTLVLCTTSEGQGSGHEVVVTVSGQTNVDRMTTFSYDPPVVYSISKSDGPTSGYTCSCTDPDQPCATLEAPVECLYLEASFTSSEVDSYCVEGFSQKVTVTIVTDVYSSNKGVYSSDAETDLQLLYSGGFWQLLQAGESIYRASTTTENPPPTGWLDMTTDPPVNVPSMKIYPGTCSKVAFRACPAGTELCERVSITLAGKNFGVQSLDWQLELISADGAMETVNVANDDIIYFSHSNIKFNLPPGQGISRLINLTVSGLPLTNKTIAFGYQTPELIGYEPSTTNLSTCGGYTITLFGKNFGSTRTKVLIGGRDARIDGQSSHPRACGSDTCEFSTSGPCIDIDTFVCYPSLYDVSPSFSFMEACDATTGTQILCEAADPVPVLSEDFASHSDFVIVTTVPAGYGADVDVYVIVDGQPSNALPFSYNQPVVTAQMPNQPDANGANAITIKGADFGCFPNDAITISFVTADTVQSISRKLSIEGMSDVPSISSILGDVSTRQLEDTTATSAGSTSSSSANSTGIVVWTSASELVWYPPKTKAGITSIILSVGGNVMSPTSQTQLKFQCSPGFYRTSTEFCDECPEGATCAGGDEMPLAKPGYWRENEVVLACDPMYACLGGNKCAEGYKEIRCGECETNYHKLNAECNVCPANKWGSVAIVVICIGVASIVSYLLTRKGVSLGLLSIGIDYFQTLSIFGNARIAWPSSLINLFSTLSAFNLNLELMAPECFSFQVSYVKKWFIIELFPLVMAATALAIFAALYAYKRFIKRRRTRLTSHMPQLFGSTLVMMYYLFLYLTRTTLDVFNCVGTIPSDGKLYMVAIYTQCFKRGGIHMQLFPFAVIAFVVYSLGYPLFVLLTLSRNRALVMEDQLLRAMQRGTSRRTNPNCWVFRKKFSKLYYQFKPNYWYWMVLIILRKFLLAGIGLLFRQDPVFQLATATFVLFVNYALQVSKKPYMSAYETQRVLADYAKRVLLETRRAKAKGETFIQPAHLRLEMHASTVTAWKSGHGDHGEGVAGSSAPPTSGLRGANEAILASQEPQNLVGYLWDHNTVEACLLFSACLVLLTGIMFESGRLGDTETGFTSASAQTLAVATTLLVAGSCVYFALVLTTELVVALRPDYYKRITRVQKVFSSPRRHLKDDAESEQGGKHRSALPAGGDASDDDDDDELEMVATMTQNPLHFNRVLSGARSLAMRARERDALAALQDIQRRGSERRRNQPHRQSEEGAPSDEDAVPRRRRSQRRRITASPERRYKHDEQTEAQLAAAIEGTEDLKTQRRSTDD